MEEKKSEGLFSHIFDMNSFEINIPALTGKILLDAATYINEENVNVSFNGRILLKRKNIVGLALIGLK